jgi:hypothetical protein
LWDSSLVLLLHVAVPLHGCSSFVVPLNGSPQCLLHIFGLSSLLVAPSLVIPRPCSSLVVPPVGVPHLLLPLFLCYIWPPIVAPRLLFPAWLFLLFLKYIWPLLLLFPASPWLFPFFRKVHMAPLAIAILYLLFPLWLLFICCSLFFRYIWPPLLLLLFICCSPMPAPCLVVDVLGL